MAKLDAQDFFSTLVARYRGRLNRLFLTILVCLLAIRILLLLVMEGGGSGDPFVDAKTVTLTSTLNDQSPTYQNVISMIKPWDDLTSHPTYGILSKTNMFDPKRVQLSARLESDAIRVYFPKALEAFARYEQAVKQGNPDAGRADLEAARQAIEQAVANKPDYKAANELKQRILGAMGIEAPTVAPVEGTVTPTPAATATPTPVAPGGPIG